MTTSSVSASLPTPTPAAGSSLRPIDPSLSFDARLDSVLPLIRTFEGNVTDWFKASIICLGDEDHFDPAVQAALDDCIRECTGGDNDVVFFEGAECMAPAPRAGFSEGLMQLGWDEKELYDRCSRAFEMGNELLRLKDELGVNQGRLALRERRQEEMGQLSGYCKSLSKEHSAAVIDSSAKKASGVNTAELDERIAALYQERVEITKAVETLRKEIDDLHVDPIAHGLMQEQVLKMEKEFDKAQEPGGDLSDEVTLDGRNASMERAKEAYRGKRRIIRAGNAHFNREMLTRWSLTESVVYISIGQLTK